MTGNNCSIASNNFLKIQCGIDKSELKKKIIKIIKKIKKCSNCGSIDTFLAKNKRNLIVNCLSCSSNFNYMTN